MKELFSESLVKDRVCELAKEIALHSYSKKIHVIFVLKGAFVFSADLIRELYRNDIDVTVDYIIAKSYVGKESTGNVQHSIADNVDVWGKEVILVEDIIDTGQTIKKVKEILVKKNPKSINVVCLLDKPSRRTVDMKADYVGFVIPDRFVVGYGLDYDERYRALPYIAQID
jgi:hypoxanthine phosphoribosyltransferase